MLAPDKPEDALDLIRTMDGFYQEAFAEYRENEAIYDGRFEWLVALPDGYDLTLPATGRAVIDEAVANLTPSDITVHYPPRGLGKKPEEDADAVRRFCRGLWRHWRRSGMDIDFLSDCAKNLALNGVACVKLVPDWTLWPVLPDGEIEGLKAQPGDALKKRIKQIKDIRERHTPLVPRSLPARTFYVDPTVGGRKTWIVERYESSAMEVRAMYAEFAEEFREYVTVAGSLVVHEVWTATTTDWKGVIHPGHHWVFVDRELANKGDEENPWGDIPYIVKHSGLGREAYEGKPQFKTVGLYTKQVKSLIAAQARRFSQFDAIMGQAAFPVGIVPSSVDPATLDFSPGAVNPVPDVLFQNSDKLWVQPRIPGGDYLNSLRVIGAELERGTTQAALRGAAVVGTDSAAQLDMTTGQAKLRLEQMKNALEDLLGELFRRALWYIDNVFKDKLSVFVAERDTDRYTLGPDQIKGRYDVATSFMPNEEQLKERKLALASDAIVKGGMSPYDALVFAGFDNADEMISRRLAYEVMNEPLVKRAMAKDLLKAWDVDADQLAMEEQMDQGMMQKALSDFMNMLQSGSLRGVGDPMTQTGAEPGGGATNQDPTAALAQAGAGPMAQPVGAQPQAQMLQAPGAAQQVIQ